MSEWNHLFCQAMQVSYKNKKETAILYNFGVWKHDKRKCFPADDYEGQVAISEREHKIKERIFESDKLGY